MPVFYSADPLPSALVHARMPPDNKTNVPATGGEPYEEVFFRNPIKALAFFSEQVHLTKEYWNVCEAYE